MKSNNLLRLSVAVVATLLAACESQPVSNELPLICVETPKMGKCTGSTPGFYYDFPSDTCRPFQYGSCHGAVPFSSRDRCESTCVARGK